MFRDRQFLLILLAQTCFGWSFSTFILLPKFLSVDLAASPTRLGVITAAFGISATVLMPWVGLRVDRAGRRNHALAGAALMAISAGLFALVRTAGPLAFVLRLGQGTANALEYVAVGALVTDLVPAHRLAQAIGLFGLTMLAMNAVAPVVAEELALRVGWAPVFLLAGLSALVAMLLLLRVRDPHRAPRARAEMPRLAAVALRRSSLSFISVSFLVGLAFGALFTFLAPYALDLGLARVSPFFTGYAVMAMIVRGLLGGLIDRFGRQRMAMLSLMLYAAVLFLTLALSQVGLVLLGVLFGAAHGVLYPALNALALEGAGPLERGTLFALFLAAFNGGWAVAGLALGAVAESTGGYPAVFVAAGSAALLGLILLWSGGRRNVGTSELGSAVS